MKNYGVMGRNLKKTYASILCWMGTEVRLTLITCKELIEFMVKEGYILWVISELRCHRSYCSVLLAHIFFFEKVFSYVLKFAWSDWRTSLQVFLKLWEVTYCTHFIIFCVFRTQSNIVDGAFCKNSLTIFAESFVIDTWQVSKYSFGSKHTFLLIFYNCP